MRNCVKGFSQVQEGRSKGAFPFFLLPDQMFQQDGVLFDSRGGYETPLGGMESDGSCKPFRKDLLVQSKQNAVYRERSPIAYLV